MSQVRKSLATTLSVFALDSFAISLVLPIFASLLLKQSAGVLPIDLPLNERIWKLGYLIAAFPIALIIGALCVGIISDRLGRKRAYFITLTGTLFATFFTGIAVHQKNYTWMVIGRALGGFFAGNLTICLSVLADISQEGHHRSRLFARLGITTAIAFMFGVFIGGIFSNPKYSIYFTHAFPFWIATGICLLNIFL
ncbi:MAG: MFS transporter, partial [Simkaniaceae bacterium]|nr:MFS transporter [Simkaniaceae bacterium]